jgi:hypothetical protein
LTLIDANLLARPRVGNVTKLLEMFQLTRLLCSVEELCCGLSRPLSQTSSKPVRAPAQVRTVNSDLAVVTTMADAARVTVQQQAMSFHRPIHARRSLKALHLQAPCNNRVRADEFVPEQTTCMPRVWRR